MKERLTGSQLAGVDSGIQPAETAGRTDAAMAGEAARETELVAVPSGYGLVASDSPRSKASSSDAASVTLADTGRAPTSSPKRRVSFAKKVAGAAIQVHADGTVGTAEPLLGPLHAPGSPPPTTSISAERPDSPAQPNALFTEDLELGRPGLRSGRKKAHLNFKSNAIAPMPVAPGSKHNPLYDGPPSRSVSGPAAHLHTRCAESMYVGGLRNCIQSTKTA